MAEVLSQSQIDSLLDSLQTKNLDGQKAEDKVEQNKFRKYDFYSPKKFTKDKLKLLKAIHDNYSRIASSQMNSLFRVSSEIEVVNVEEQRYYEFANALYEKDVMAIVDVQIPSKSKNPPIVLHVSTPIVAHLIDRMLGGVGEDIAPVPDDYEYSDIELVLYRKIVEYLTCNMKDAWSTHLFMDFQCSHIESNISLFQDIGVDETVVIVALHVDLKNISGKINICIPGALLSNVFALMEEKKISAKDDSYSEKENKEKILNSIKESVLEMVVQLGSVELDLQDIYNLNKGDIIGLHKPKDSKVKLFVENEPWFEGSLGVYKKNVAVQIDERIQEKR